MESNFLIKLVCGRSRAGKTTFCRQFEHVIHLDCYGMIPKNYEKVLKKVAETNDDIVVDGIYDTSELRVDLINAYKGCGKTCIWLDTPLDVIEQRFGNFIPPKHPYAFEPPTLSEGWDEIRIIRGSNECTYRKK